MLLYFFHFLPNNNSHTENHGGWCQNLHFFFFFQKKFYSVRPQEKTMYGPSQPQQVGKIISNMFFLAPPMPQRLFLDPWSRRFLYYRSLLIQLCMKENIKGKSLWRCQVRSVESKVLCLN